MAHVESVVVHPAHRGRGPQRAMVACCEELLAAAGSRWAMCTVAPANTPSLRSFRALGYQVVGTGPAYAGLTRHTLVKRLPAARSAGRRSRCAWPASRGAFRAQLSVGTIPTTAHPAVMAWPTVMLLELASVATATTAATRSVMSASGTCP